MKTRWPIWAVWLAVVGAASALFAQPRLLTVEVVDLEGRPIDGVFLRLAGDEPDARVRKGRVELQLPLEVQPGDDVLLHLEDPNYAFLEPADGWLRVPRTGLGQLTRVTLLRRGRPDQLEREAVRRALAEQVTDRLKEGEARPSTEALTTALFESARKYGLDPTDIDRALRTWDQEALGDLDRRLLDRYLDFFPQRLESRGGQLIFTGPVLIHDGAAEYFLRAPLDGLGFGESTVLEVGSVPEEATEGVDCVWTIRPADFLIVQGDDRHDCALAVTLPEGPVKRYGPKLTLDIEIQILRDGVLQSLIQESASVDNGLALHVMVEGAPLTPSGQALVTVGRVGETSSLPAIYQCSWSTTPAPFRWVPTAANGCTARIELQPLDQWVSDILVDWLSSLQTGRGPSWVVTATLDGRPVPGGTAQFSVEVHETRPRKHLEAELDARLREETERRLAEKDRNQLNSELEALGLPSLRSLQASDLRLNAEIGSRGWQLRVLYVGESGEARWITGRRSVLRVLLSADGTNFGTAGQMSRRDPRELAQLDHYWVKIEVTSRSSQRVGPFRLEMDGEALLLEAARRFWNGLDGPRRQKLACSRFTGLRPSSSWEARILLPLLRSVSVHRVNGTVQRSETYGASLATLESPTFQPVPRPLAGAPYVIQMHWNDADAESFECPADYGEGGPRSGFHHALKRAAASTVDGPAEIEVFVEKDYRGKWRIQFERRFQPAFVRYSTDGETWKTVKPSGRYGTFVSIGDAQGERLELRFVAEDGGELGYESAGKFEPG